VLLVPGVLNLLLWGGAEYLRRSRGLALTPRWLARLALACCFGFLTWAGVDALVGRNLTGDDTIAVLVVLAVEAGIALYAVNVRDDVFPLALTAASLIVLSTTKLGDYADWDRVGGLFMIAVWLVLSSTLSGRVLMACVREWHRTEDAA
jgi:hypothetical protein